MSQYIIQTRDLTKTYGEQKSVSNLNMHVRKGKIYGLLSLMLMIRFYKKWTR